MLVRSSCGVERSRFESVAIRVDSVCDDWPIPLHQLAKVCRFLFDVGRPGDDSWAEIIGPVTSIRAETECIGECRDRRPAASFTSASRPSIRRLMNTTAHDFVTVDMRGLKAALVARAQAERVSVSVLVRGAVARDLGLSEAAEPGEPTLRQALGSPASSCRSVSRLRKPHGSLRSARCRPVARRLPRRPGGRVPVLSSGASRAEHLATLIASSAELSTLSRNLRHLTAAAAR